MHTSLENSVFNKNIHYSYFRIILYQMADSFQEAVDMRILILNVMGNFALDRGLKKC